MTTYPVGYGTQEMTLDELRSAHGGRMEPEYARRLFAWLEYKGGVVGMTLPGPASGRLGRPQEYAPLAPELCRNGYFNGEDIRLDGAIRMTPR